MPIRTAIWKVATQPEPLAESSLAKEQLLEAMIIAAPRLLSDERMLIGLQEDTGFGGRVDLLAMMLTTFDLEVPVRNSREFMLRPTAANFQRSVAGDERSNSRHLPEDLAVLLGHQNREV